MKKIIFIINLFLFCFFAEAQTGIGTTTPNASAKLDVYSTNKGFLPPRVTLTSTTDASTIASPAEGLLVYNLGSSGLQAGYYYWNNASWATIATASSAGNGVTSMDMVKLYGKAYSAATADSTIANATGYKFLVPVSGRYLFDFSSTGYGNAYFTFKVRQGNIVLAVDSQYSYNNTVHVEYNGKVELNLQAGNTYNVFVFSSGSRDGGDFDRVYYKMVAGNLPVTGQTVEYGIARYTGADGSAIADNAIVPFDATASGNLNWSGNKFTLKANKTYELESSLAIYISGSTVAGRFQIYDYTNSVALANGLFMSQNGAGSNGQSANSPMKGIITPTSDIQVGIRLLDHYGPNGPSIVGNAVATGVQSAANASYFLVKQIGSSAIVNPWVISGSNVYNTTGNVGIGTTAPASALTVGSATGSIGGEITINPQATTNEGGQISIKRSLSGGTVDWTLDHYGTSNADARFRIFGGSSETNGISIKENGNVGLGTINPTAKLNLSGGGIRIHTGFGNSATRPALNTSTIGNYEIRAIGGFTQADATDDGFLRLSAGGGTSSAAQASIDLSGYSVNAEMNNNIVMRTKGVESLRIDENGRLGIGTSSPYNKLHVQSTEGTSVYIESTTSDNNGMMVLNANTSQNWANNFHEFIYFRNQGNNIGGIIASNGGNMVSYGTTSDYRLKRDLREFSGLDLVNKIKTYDFAWKRDSSRMFGVMAHELQAILPYAVNGQKDEVDVNGKIIPQSVDYGKLTPILVKAIQEQDVIIKEQVEKLIKLSKEKDSIEKRVSDLELLIKKLIEKNN